MFLLFKRYPLTEFFFQILTGIEPCFCQGNKKQTFIRWQSCLFPASSLGALRYHYGTIAVALRSMTVLLPQWYRNAKAMLFRKEQAGKKILDEFGYLAK
jgi:hypothetical protein